MFDEPKTLVPALKRSRRLHKKNEDRIKKSMLTRTIVLDSGTKDMSVASIYET